MLAKKGVFTERIGYQTRYFIPAEKDTVKIMDGVLKISPVSRVESNQERAAVKAANTPERGKPSILADLKAAVASVSAAPGNSKNVELAM